MGVKVFIVNGYPGSGKSTFVKFCQEEIGENLCKDLSTVDLVKQLAYECGWNGEKTPENRKFLSDLKDLLTEWNDIPYKDIANTIRIFEDELIAYIGSTAGSFVFVQCREPQEIQKFVDRLGAQTIFVRGNHEKTLSNHADKLVEDFEYDYYIDNYGTLDDLREKAIKFVKQ